MRVRIVLDVDPAQEPIGGLLSVDDAPARSFSGWLALARAIDTALVSARSPEVPGASTAGEERGGTECEG